MLISSSTRPLSFYTHVPHGRLLGSIGMTAGVNTSVGGRGQHDHRRDGSLQVKEPPRLVAQLESGAESGEWPAVAGPVGRARTLPSRRRLKAP